MSLYRYLGMDVNEAYLGALFLHRQLWCSAMPKRRHQQAAFLTEAPIRSLFARKIRNALLVNAAVLAALRAKENVWCPATMLTASIPEVVAAATVAWSIFFG